MSQQAPLFKKTVALLACYMMLTLNFNPAYASGGPGSGSSATSGGGDAGSGGTSGGGGTGTGGRTLASLKTAQQYQVQQPLNSAT